MNYIISSHGGYAIAALHSCEMITGDLPNFYTYSFKGQNNINDVKKDYEDIIDRNNLNYKSTIILTDINSGTPNNAAIMLAAEKKIKSIYTGFSLSDLVFIAMGEEIDKVFESKLENSGKIKIPEIDENEEEEED
ncbi:PTS sugar transporter subunit IIA [Companilactobacillus halodurans]|uniref:PTS EIIA type-4 domain-containing protein n=1 Tax=Companilactobacillus halodurans TaxID=2584183 RepID=A0A5P0ZX20_9LACO|nr:hypothetical protein [Companilactobacillus halodurans]MQS75145.1 hypothetical protein [Companilactobacillus halodurans]MQS97591.1 hypothetical protein [Companilactobacillus halodurans]